MSEEMEKLAKENSELKNQLAQQQKNFDVFSAQFDAHKQMLSESINAHLLAKANILLLQKENTNLLNEITSLKSQIDELKKLSCL